MMAMSDGSEMQFLIAIRAGPEFALTGFRAYSSEPDLVEDNLKVMTGTFLPWLSLLRFRSEGAPSLLPAPSPGGMDGLWWGIAHGHDPGHGHDDAHGHQPPPDHVLAGHFFEGTPPQGTARPDRAALDKALLTEWGNYTEQGNTITLTFNDGHSEVLERNGESWSGWGYDLSGHAAWPMARGWMAAFHGCIIWVSRPVAGFPGGSHPQA